MILHIHIMKSIEEIKNEIFFAISDKKINGFLENDCLYIASSRIYLIFIILLISVPVFGIGILSLIASLGYKLRYFYWIPVTYLLIISVLCKLSKDYIVYDYNRGQIFFATKLFNATIWKGYHIDVRNILEIGIDHILDQRQMPISYRLQALFNKPVTYDIYEKVSKPNIVYLNTEGKIKRFFALFYEKELEDNYKNFVELIGNLLEIPCKICEKNQKLKVSNVNNKKFLEIIPLDINEEIRNEQKQRFKLAFFQFFICGILPFEIILISQYGFIESFYIWPKIIKYIVFVLIPRDLGLR